MVVKWDVKAINDLKEYVSYSKTSTPKEYVKQLVA